MQIFTSVCKDNKYGYEMVASECSYNFACNYIERNLNYKISKCSKDIMRGLTEIETKNITFVYDEDRGYLMRKE